MNDLDLCLFRGRLRIKVMSTLASQLTLNISETVRDTGLFPKDHHLWKIQWSRDPPKGQTHDPNTFRAQYLKNSWAYTIRDDST